MAFLDNLRMDKTTINALVQSIELSSNKWVIFAYDRVPAHRDSAIHPAQYVQSWCLPTPLLTSLNKYKSGLKATIKVDISRQEVYRPNEAKALEIPLTEFEHNNCSAWSSAEKHRHCDRS